MAFPKSVSTVLLTLCLASCDAERPTKPAQVSTPTSARAMSVPAVRTIYFNGKVFTANEKQLWSEGVVVDGSIIVAVGTTQEVLALEKEGTKLVDLEGATMIPGFNDAHVHPFDSNLFPRAAVLNLATDFLPNPGPSLQDILTLIKRGAASNPPGTWLMASIGTNVIEDPNTTRVALDAAAPNHPVLLASWFGHGTYINTTAMRIAGIGEQEPDPIGGFYGRFPGSTVVNGAVHEYAEHQLRRFFAGQMTDQEFRAIYERFAADAARMGYTSVQEMSVGVPEARHVRLVSQSNIPIRWRAICFPLSVKEECERLPPQSSAEPFPRLTASGIKWIADGTFIERLAFLRDEYADAPGVRGQPNFPSSTIEQQLERSLGAAFLGGQPLFHAVGDATADMVLDRMSAMASDEQWRLRRPRIEHGTLLRRDRFESARRKGAFIVQNPVHFALAPIAAARLSSDQLTAIDPMRSLLEANIKVAIGSDAVASPGNPFLDLFFAVIQPTHQSEALTIEQAVIAYTRTAAEAEFQEAWKGTIAAGKVADLVVLSQNIFSVAPQDIPRTRALLTIVGGKVVFNGGFGTSP
jgi:predicted amidohydrolase YtcJ